MISVEEAKELIKNSAVTFSPVWKPLEEVEGMVLAEGVKAHHDFPPFPQSSMDGYAFRFRDLKPGQPLKIEGEAPAGTPYEADLEPDAAVRIFTGAAVPAGADTIVMQEKVSVTDGQLLINDAEIKQWTNIRPAGSEIKSGTIALEKGSRLTPGAIGFLAGIGVDRVSVYPKPVVSLLVTGDELQTPGTTLKFGQVYESNSYTIRAALLQQRIELESLFMVEDNPEALRETLEEALEISDLVLLTGGVSVGDYDFVADTAEKLGIKKVFHKVSQRPGKPLFFGTRDNKLVFGLPGNPASVLSCFYQYVLLALGKLCGDDFSLPTAKVPLGTTIEKTPALTFFLKGYWDGKKAVPLDAQESYRMYSFARANCLIQLPEPPGKYQEGELITIHLIQ